MVLGLVIGLVFLVVESRAETPIVPVSLFRDRTFSVASVVVLLAVSGLFISIVFLPRYFQLVHGASATESGWQIMTLLFGLIVGAISRRSDRGPDRALEVAAAGGDGRGRPGHGAAVRSDRGLVHAAGLDGHVPDRPGARPHQLRPDGGGADDIAARSARGRDQHAHLLPPAGCVHLARHRWFALLGDLP